MVIETYPYVDSDGISHDDFILHESDSGKTILQVETGVEYYSAVDIYPCPYTYTETENDRDTV